MLKRALAMYTQCMLTWKYSSIDSRHALQRKVPKTVLLLRIGYVCVSESRPLGTTVPGLYLAHL